MEKQLSVQEAYTATFAFLEHYYEMTQSDGVGALLGSMSLLPDGKPADSALWDDWLDAVHRAQEGDVKTDLEIHK